MPASQELIAAGTPIVRRLGGTLRQELVPFLMTNAMCRNMVKPSRIKSSTRVTDRVCLPATQTNLAGRFPPYFPPDTFAKWIAGKGLGNIPQPRRFVAARQGDLAVGAQGHAKHRTLMLQGWAQPLARSRVPQTCGIVRAPRQGNLSTRPFNRQSPPPR